MPAQALDVLSPDEQERAGRFRFERDRRRWVTCRSALRQILGKYMDVPAGDIRFSYLENGKPLLCAVPGRLAPHFNVSHSADMGVVAVTAAGPVGIDVEELRPVPDALDIGRNFLAPGEAALLKQCTGLALSETFLRIWTCKEACVKATGAGLSQSLSDFEISFSGDAPPALLSLVPGDPSFQMWKLRLISPGPGYIGALAMHVERMPKLEFFTFPPTLR